MFKDLFPVSKEIFVTKTNRLILTYLLTYLLPYSMEQSPSWEANLLSASQEITCILWNPKVHYRIRKFPHLSLSWASSIQSINPHPNSWRSILILSSHIRLGLPSSLFLSVFSTKNPVYAALLPHMGYVPHRSNPSQFFESRRIRSDSSRCHHPNNIGWGVQIIKLLIM